MAKRLEADVLRGELDNTRRGCVTGRIWLDGSDAPILLQLKGNAHRDIAGCLLSFSNPSPTPRTGATLSAVQRGLVGDCTASRKVRLYQPGQEKDTVPERWGNALYLEWFSESDGRVVIESTSFDVTISKPRWRMTDAEGAQQVQKNRDALLDWLAYLAEESSEQPPYAPDDEEPMDEFQWEQFLRESDELTDRYAAALEKHKDHPDCERRVAHEMGWTWLEEALEAEERGALESDDDEDDDYDEDEAEFPAIEPNPLTEGRDWVRDEHGFVQHPLTARAHRIGMAIWHQCDEMGLLGEDGDTDVQGMVFQAQTLASKLAGALDHLAYEDEREPGFVVATLKRALSYLHESLAHADTVMAKHSLDRTILMPFRQHLFDIREQILALMERFRRKQW